MTSAKSLTGKPLIYQILPRYWGGYQGKNVRNGSLEENGCGRFADMDEKSLAYIKGLNFTHVWYTGVIRHSTLCNTAGCTPSHPQFVKGEAGSPYAISDYYDVNPYLAVDPDKRMDEFDDMVRRTHSAGLKVLIDFVPNHVSRDNVNFGLNDDKTAHWAPENDFFYYPESPLTLPVPFTPTSAFPEPYFECPARATGNNCFSPSPSINDWYETVKLNYCDFHTGTWDKILAILKFWIDRGVDGFRCDMVELVPAEFFTWLISEVKKYAPKTIFIAEVYQKEEYNRYIKDVGFDFLYDKSGLYDTLRDIMNKNAMDGLSPVELWQSTRRITSNWQFLGDLQPRMLNFLENHDEVRQSSSAGVSDPSRTYAALAVSALLNNAPFMVYSGEEVGENAPCSEGFSGQDGRSTIFDWWKSASSDALWKYSHAIAPLDVPQKAVLDKYAEVLNLASSDLCSKGSVYDLCYCNYSSPGFDPDRHFAFLRYDDRQALLVLCNFSSQDADVTLDIPLFGGKKVNIKASAFNFSTIIINLAS